MKLAISYSPIHDRSVLGAGIPNSGPMECLPSVALQDLHPVR
jgi:hypothetical protein